MLVIRLLLLIKISISFAFADNLISIDQVTSGNGNSTTVTVDGSDNTVKYSFGGANNTVNIDQKGDDAYVGYTTAWGSGASWGGDLDGDYNNLLTKQLCNQSLCEGDRFEFHIQGDSNTVTLGQGFRVLTNGTFETPDNLEYGGHFTQLDIHGSNNTFIGSQRSAGDNHSNTTGIYGSNNSVYTRQEYNANKSIDLTIQNNNNDVDIIQGGSASHSATISLSGSYGTDLDLTQYSNTAQTYSLTQSCATVGGCSVSVTQQ
jgi:hypothetical protein